MKLTRLELSGFKSFATTANLPFEDGVTSIVGPNGCGKSNISDAVRWVLGEQRVRLLRGAKMDEVIFQGSAKRRPVNLAEVSLYLDNSDSALPVSYNEVVITRRLSRNGQSDYLVNQSPIRLRDLQDLLKGTGLGSDVGVVIEAQMIDRLLSDKPDERRSMFEEAAGIGLYRDRKENTERKLDKTLEDLRRLDDLISEVQTQVRSLARQRGKAERYEKFSAERFAIVMTLTKRTLARMSDEESDLRTRRSELSQLIPQARERLVALERSREQSIQARATQEARRTELERRLAEARLEVGRLEGELKVASERLENAANRKTRAAEERRLAEERAKQAEREREAAATERTAAASARESVQTELDLRSTSEEEVRGQLTMQRELVREIEDKLQRHAETSRALAGERVAVEADATDLKQLAAEAEERCRECAREFETVRQRVDGIRAALELRQRQAQAATNELHRARHNLAAAREHEAAIRVQRHAAEEQIAQRAARRKALEALETEREGLAPAARELLRQRERFGDAILGPLSDYVSTSQEDARAAENLLAEWLHAVLVRDEQAVEDVRRWHAESTPGPLVLLPISAAPNGDDGSDALDIVVQSPAEGWVRALLAGTSTLGAGADAVRRANGAVFLPGSGAAGPISRRAELDALVRELNAAERALDQLIHTAERAAHEHQQAERALETASEAAEAARASLRETETSADEADRNSHRVEREKIEADETLARLTQRTEQRTARLKEIEQEMTSGQKERDRVAADLERQRATLREIEEAQEAARERRVHWQVEEAQVSAREEAAQQRESRAAEILAEARNAMTALDSELASIDEGTRDISTKRARWNEELNEKRVEVEEMQRAATGAETAVHDADRAVKQADEELAKAREVLEQLNEESHRIDLSLTEGAGHRQALIERIEAEWHKPLDDLIENAEEVDGETAVLEEEAERLAQTLETLGPVNPLAVQEHADETKRLDFLTEQREDLVDARTSLLKALREIEETARQLFLDSFNQIRKNFHTVFQTLFEGGECDVRLESEADPLGSGIDIFAAPRGKRVQRIHLLSSGERALVALSLLFSIYLTKPAPFCLLDEVDAPLDDANVIRFVRLLEEFKADTQFIVITHNPRTMQVADAVYGVTMQEPGVSTIVGVRLGEAEALAS